MTDDWRSNQEGSYDPADVDTVLSSEKAQAYWRQGTLDPGNILVRVRRAYQITPGYVKAAILWLCEGEHPYAGKVLSGKGYGEAEPRTLIWLGARINVGVAEQVLRQLTTVIPRTMSKQQREHSLVNGFDDMARGGVPDSPIKVVAVQIAPSYSR